MILRCAFAVFGIREGLILCLSGIEDSCDLIPVLKQVLEPVCVHECDNVKSVGGPERISLILLRGRIASGM